MVIRFTQESDAVGPERGRDTGLRPFGLPDVRIVLREVTL
jgi:hypothetical protein